MMGCQGWDLGFVGLVLGLVAVVHSSGPLKLCSGEWRRWETDAGAEVCYELDGTEALASGHGRDAEA